MNALNSLDAFFSEQRVRWDNPDAKGHMRNSACLDLSVQARFRVVTDIYKAEGDLAARVRADAAVFHLATGGIGPAPERMLELLRAARVEPGSKNPAPA